MNVSTWGSKLASAGLEAEVGRTWGQPAFAAGGAILGDFCPAEGAGPGPP